MKNLFKIFLSLFESKYTTYKFVERKLYRKEILETKNSSGYYGDDLDFYTVRTGKFYFITKEVWMAYHKNTGLPKYKYINVPNNDDEVKAFKIKRGYEIHT